MGYRLRASRYPAAPLALRGPSSMPTGRLGGALGPRGRASPFCSRRARVTDESLSSEPGRILSPYIPIGAEIGAYRIEALD